MSKTPAWQRSEGKSKSGGLNETGRKSYERENPGSNLKAPVKSGNNKRRGSFGVRMGSNKGPERKPDGSPTRLLKSLQAWGFKSKADARKRGRSILASHRA
nr:hypothetical protein [uncultured Mediterranean phage uvMED]|tara:strand:- start:1964 stop:2266 length:303 start_codon:yes stop_codon:yes gene_type:complete